MDLFRFGTRSLEDDPARKERLVRIRRNIEASIKFEEDAMSKPLNASTLKRIYNIDSLWIVSDEDTKRLGSANYSREVITFKDLKDKYGNLNSIRLQKGSEKYHVVEKGEKIYAFSTPLELENSDVMMILREIESSLGKKRIFLSSNTNLTE
jgi:hypothetical protein